MLRPARRWQAPAKAPPSASIADVFRLRLSNPTDSTADTPWNEDNERRFQKHFNRPSPFYTQLDWSNLDAT